jgi:hypothetical protein
MQLSKVLLSHCTVLKPDQEGTIEIFCNLCSDFGQRFSFLCGFMRRIDPHLSRFFFKE